MGGENALHLLEGDFMLRNRMMMIVLSALGLVAIALLVLAGILLIQSASAETVEPEVTGTAVAAATSTPSPIPATATASTLPAPAVVVLPTDTPLPATNTPIPTDTPLPTETPIPTTTATPIPPTNTSRPFVATNTPIPATNTPAPTTAPVGVSGLVASRFVLPDGTNFNKNSPIWFEFFVSNSSGGAVPFGALGVMPRKGGADRVDMVQVSWGGNPGDAVPAAGLDWRDNIRLSESGSYTLRLAICFDAYNACKNGSGTWHTLSPEIAITVN